MSPTDHSSNYAAERVATDRRLTDAMAAAQGGDRAAYELVLRDCVPVVRRIARAQGADANVVDDVVQDVLITLHGARATFDPSRSFVAWLTAITQRRTIDILRKQGRRAAREVYAPLAAETHAAEGDPGERRPARAAMPASSAPRSRPCPKASVRQSRRWRLKKIRSRMHPNAPAERNRH